MSTIEHTLPPNDNTVHVSVEQLLNMRLHLKDYSLFVANHKRSPLIGAYQSKLRGRGIDFDQVRPYQPGDDIRNIDWRVTARTQQTHTKLFHEEKERPVFILLEQSTSLFFGSTYSIKSVAGAKLASFLGWLALHNHDRIGGLVFNETQQKLVRPKLNKRNLLQFIEYTCLLNSHLTTRTPHDSSHQSFLRALKQTYQLLRPGSLIFIIVDERSLNTDIEQILLHLAKHLTLILLPIYDPLDHQLPMAGTLRFTQANHEIIIDTHNKKIRQAYEQKANQRQQQWQTLSKRIGAKLWPINTGLDIVEQIKPLLHTK